MKEKRPSPVMRLLQWAGPERKWLILSVLCAFGSGILVITSYIGIYRLMDAVLSGACTKAVIADCALLEEARLEQPLSYLLMRQERQRNNSGAS